MTGLLQRVEANLRDRKLIARGRAVLVAVSGGLDSMVLLHMLHSLAAKMKCPLTVAHFNHQLRGRASAADQVLVQCEAAKLGLECHWEAADVRAFAARSGISIEMAARKLRHEFFVRVARRCNISVVALAHHADDQVEQFFLRLLRGSGLDGLAGMKWRSDSPADKSVQLIRPLLNCSKAELADFAAVQKIRFREDASNFKSDFLRNRIRNELLPLLRRDYQPGIDQVVARLMEIARAENELVETLARESDATSFSKSPLAIQRRRLQQGLVAAGVPVDFELIEKLRTTPDEFVSVAAGAGVARDRQGRIQLRRSKPVTFSKASLLVELGDGAGRVKFAGRYFDWKTEACSGVIAAPKRKPFVERFDAGRIGRRITLRHWLPGDRFQPIGFKSAVKLQDLFVNAKIPAARRRQLVLATTADGEIFWVEGLRIGENFKLTPQTRRQLTWNHPKIAG